MKEPPVRVGTWFNGDAVVACVAIHEGDAEYGSGDDDDEPESVLRPRFYVRWYSPGDSVDAASSGSTVGPFDSLDAAVAYVVSTKGVDGLRWSE